jgi:uncharacterized protein (DUF1501 family)
LVVIQLFGGNDGLNTVIPAENDNYHAIRPTIGLGTDKALRIFNSEFYLHPALAAGANNGMLGMMEAGRLAVINRVGYPNPNLSHFRSTDIWLSGLNSSEASERLTDGWLGRLFAEKYPNFPDILPEHPLALQIGGTLSMLLKSAKGDMGIAITDPNRFFENGQGLSPDLEPLPETDDYSREFNYIRSVAESAESYSTIVKNAYDNGKNAVEYGAGFPQQLRLVSKLISGGLKTRVYLVYLGGFDTHVMQQSESDPMGGSHPRLLEALSTGVSQFMDDAIRQGFADRVVGMTVSEFGRRPYENGSRGTDHGAASAQFVFGTRVRSAVYGENPTLSKEELTQNGDVLHEFDYREIYSDIMRTWFGASDEVVSTVLGRDDITPLSVLQTPVGVSEGDGTSARAPMLAASLYPNPSRGPATLTVQAPVAGILSIEYSDVAGRALGNKTVRVDAPGAVSVRLAPPAWDGALVVVARLGHRMCTIPWRVVR